ncbi:MAG: O-antigen ligase family protein [Anaerolineae bacterium]|nr:O-antigen ligase family protein [Anaerolineae bacterium]
MRLGLFGLLLLALYMLLIGGSALYGIVFPVRVAHHVIVTALFSFWLIRRIRRGEGLPWTPLNPVIAAAGVIWIISAIFGHDPRMSLERLWFALWLSLAFWFFADLMQRGKQRLLFETQLIIATLVVGMALFELATFYFGLGVFPGSAIGWLEVGYLIPLQVPRLTQPLGISTLLAGYVVPLSLIAIGWARSSKTIYRPVLIVLALGLIAVLLLTGSRGGYLALGIGVGVLIALRLAQAPAFTQRIGPRLIAFGAISGVIIAVFGLVIVSLSANRGLGDEGRLDMWRSSVQMLIDHPITGVGYGQFGRAFREYRDPMIAQDKLASAHNLYLNVAAETGLMGVVVGLAAFWIIGRKWWDHRQKAESRERQFRLDAVMAALIGLGFHSLVDVFTIMPIVLTALLLIAYGVIGNATRIERRFTPPWTAILALILVLGYSGFWVIGNQALGEYNRSLDGNLSAADRAAALDPHIGLYQLQVAYLTNTRPAYEQALIREPTWEVGWLNLAALAERDGDYPAALIALDRARQLHYDSEGWLHWGRIAEAHGLAEVRTIQASYQHYITIWAGSRLPLSGYWMETDLRRAALEQALLEIDSPEIAYRVWQVHDPTRLAAIAPTHPWTRAEHALNTGQIEQAIAEFYALTDAQPRNGDYRVSLARALITRDPIEAERQLQIADLLGTRYESTALVRIQLATTPESADEWRLRAIPPRVILGEFAGVLYERVGTFDVLPEVRHLGPGRASLAPWYDLAAKADDPAPIYRAILDYAPDEREARERLDARRVIKAYVIIRTQVTK